VESDLNELGEKGIRGVAWVGIEIGLHRDNKRRADSGEKTREEQDTIHIFGVSFKEVAVMFLCDLFVQPPETRPIVFATLRHNRRILENFQYLLHGIR
jgi:hypothetical protein